jgi:hypothetical protein
VATLGQVILAMGCFYGVTFDATRVYWRLRRTPAGPDARARVRAFMFFMLAICLFFTWFTIVYWDRRFDIWPGVDLMKVMGFQWYWLPRLILGIGVVQFWRVLRSR